MGPSSTSYICQQWPKYRAFEILHCDSHEANSQHWRDSLENQTIETSYLLDSNTEYTTQGYEDPQSEDHANSSQDQKNDSLNSNVNETIHLPAEIIVLYESSHDQSISTND